MEKKQKPEVELVRLFRRNGCLRLPNESRFEQEGYARYKKGWEIRWVAFGEEEGRRVARLLEQAGFKPGKPYSKGSRTVHPVYGKESVERFRKLLSENQGGFEDARI